VSNTSCGEPLNVQPSVLRAHSVRAFDVVHQTDLTYVEGCWKLCGDAHCCHYDRYRRESTPQDRGMTRIPMLAGEYRYMEERGLLSQYSSPRLETHALPLRSGLYRFELLTVPASGRCPCDHNRRPTVCRLYPLLPVYAVGRGLVGIDTNFGVFEEVEELAKIERACKVTQAPFTQFDHFLRIATAVADSPDCMFGMMAYSLIKRHFRDRLLGIMRDQGLPAYPALGMMMSSGAMYDRDLLIADLDDMAAEFQRVYGPDFAPA